MGKKKISGITTFVLGLVVVVLLIAGFYFISSSDTDKEEDTTTTNASNTVHDDSIAGTTQADVEYTEVTTGKDNTVNVDSLAGKTAVLECKVVAVDADAVGFVDVAPVEDNGIKRIACYVADGTDEQLLRLANELQVGDRVTITGTFDGEPTGVEGTVKFVVDTLQNN